MLIAILEYPLALMFGRTISMYIYYVYQYLREDLTPYYIGKGKHKRAWNSNHAINLPTNKELIQLIAHNLSESEAHQLEIKLIAHYGRKDINTGILRNRSDGGEGNSGLIHSTETKQKMSSSQKKKIVTLSARANMSAGSIGRIVSIETREKLSISSKGRCKSESAKQNMSLARKNKPWSEARITAQKNRTRKSCS